MLSKWQLTSRMHAQQYTNGADHTAVVGKSRIRNDINLHGSVVPEREREGAGGTDRQTGRQEGRQTDRKTDRQRDRDRQKQTGRDRQTEKERDRQTETDTERDYGGREGGGELEGEGGGEIGKSFKWSSVTRTGDIRATWKTIKPKRCVLPVQRVCCSCFVVAHICCHVRTRSHGIFSS